jgi:hypothetical protein
MTTMWFLAPPRAWTRFPFAAAVRYTYFATGADPTNEIACTPACTRRASTASRAPCTTFSTPAGKPASRKISARRCPPSGVRSEGLSTNVLPATIARGNIHSGIITGKLKGGIPAHTPTGNR